VKTTEQHEDAVTAFSQEPSYFLSVIGFHVPLRHLRSSVRYARRGAERSHKSRRTPVWNDLPRVISDLSNVTFF